jgi:hypothetical protein
MLRPTQSHSKGKKRAGRTPSPRPTKRIHSDIHPDDEWLIEIHSKAWKSETARAELFRETHFTAAHYIELQKRLMDHCPGRDLLDYEGDDVQSIKSEFLRTFEATQKPGVPLSHVEHNQDKMV